MRRHGAVVGGGVGGGCGITSALHEDPPIMPSRPVTAAPAEMVEVTDDDDEGGPSPLPPAKQQQQPAAAAAKQVRGRCLFAAAWCLA